MLIAMDHMDDVPKEHEIGVGLVLYKSVFGTGYIVCGKIDMSWDKSSNTPLT
jgi:hypothetical protein